MPVDILMPALSPTMEKGNLAKWLKNEGDKVKSGDIIAEIETDKANMVFESDAAGTLVEIVAGEGDTLPIGEVIARVGEASCAVSTCRSSSRASNGAAPLASGAACSARKGWRSGRVSWPDWSMPDCRWSALLPR